MLQPPNTVSRGRAGLEGEQESWPDGGLQVGASQAWGQGFWQEPHSLWRPRGALGELELLIVPSPMDIILGPWELASHSGPQCSADVSSESPTKSGPGLLSRGGGRRADTPTGLFFLPGPTLE